MAKLPNYNGSIDLIAGLRAKNNGEFPLMEAHDILVDESGTRLDEKLESIGTGANGKDGEDGVSVTHSWNGTVLTVTSASGTSSADLKGEKGDKGDTGAQGEKGDTGAQGEQGEKGADGKDGTDGTDGRGIDRIELTTKGAEKNSLNDTYTIYYTDGTTSTYTVTNGADGEDGADGTGGTSTGGGSYVLELTSESGTLTDEQYNAVVANAPNVVVKTTVIGGDGYLPLVLNVPDTQIIFAASMSESTDEDTAVNLNAMMCMIISTTKQYVFVTMPSKLATTTYVDNAVANAGGGGGIIDVTELPTENIDEKSIYRTPTISGAEVYVVAPMGEDGAYLRLTAAEFFNIDASAVHIIVTEDPENEELTASTDTELYLYVKRESGEVWLNYGSKMKFSSVLYSLLENTVEDGGWTDDINAEPETPAVYAFATEFAYKYYAYKDGTWTELSNNDSGSSGNLGVKSQTFSTIAEVESFLMSDSVKGWRMEVVGTVYFTPTDSTNKYEFDCVFDVSNCKMSGGAYQIMYKQLGIPNSFRHTILTNGSTRISQPSVLIGTTSYAGSDTNVDYSNLTSITLYYF